MWTPLASITQILQLLLDLREQQITTNSLLRELYTAQTRKTPLTPLPHVSLIPRAAPLARPYTASAVFVHTREDEARRQAELRRQQDHPLRETLTPPASPMADLGVPGEEAPEATDSLTALQRGEQFAHSPLQRLLDQ